MTDIRYIDSTDRVNLFLHDPNQIVDNLPTHIYTVQYDPMSKQFYLEKMFSEFNIPDKVYGNVYERVERICKRYEKDDKSLGVLLSGVKGSGKTVLSTIMIHKFLNEYKKPVIMVNKCFGDIPSDFVEFISKFNNALFVFDEFEKVFSEREQQAAFLNFFDDKTNSNRLSLVLTNTTYLNDFLLSRPSRLFYHFKYESLSEDVITEVLNLNGLSDVVPDVLLLAKKASCFTFDILNTIIDEIKLTGNKDIINLVEDLNIQFYEQQHGMYKSEVVSVQQLTHTEYDLKLSDLKVIGNDDNPNLYYTLHNGCTDYQELSTTKLESYNPVTSEYTYLMYLDYIYNDDEESKNITAIAEYNEILYRITVKREFVSPF